MVSKILESFSAYLKKGSGWTLKRVVRLNITRGRNKPFKGSSKIPLPEGLRGTKKLINMANKDDQCFKCATTKAFNLVKGEKNAHCITKELERQSEEFNWDGIKFPTPYEERMYKKFEVHVGSGDNLRIIPLYVPKVRRERIARIFFFKKNENSHYCVIRDMSRLISAQVRSDHGEIYVCDYCLNYFCSQEKLDKHTESCSKHDAVNTVFPEPDKNILKFKNIQNCVECPIKIYADTESFLVPIDEKRGETELYQRHVMSAFCFYVVSRVKGFSMDPVTYLMQSEDDEVERIFMEKLEEVTKEIYETFKIPVKMIFDEEAKKFHESLTECYACGKTFDEGDFNMTKVRDHCHYTGKYRGALHLLCNLRLKRVRTIPVIFHNLSGYDSHLFVKRLADTIGRVDCIPQNAEKYITFNKNVHLDTIVRNEKEIKVYSRLKFIDSFRFMQSSLASLVKNITKFEHTDRYFTSEQQELLRRKEVYPYEYMTDFSKFAETELPPKEAFNR